MKIIIYGANGMLGKRLVEQFKENELYLFGSKANGDVKKLDVSNGSDIIGSILSINPSLVINSAAFTDVDLCEKEKGYAAVVNDYSINNMVVGCKKAGSKFLHFSTDYVFDGESNIGYTEEDIPKNPVNEYGRTKFNAESRLIGHKRELYFYLVRTSWMFAEEKGFVNAIRNRALVNNELEVVSDEIGCPTYASDLAIAVKELVSNDKYARGIYHITNSGFCSRADYAREIIKQAGLECKVKNVTQDYYIEKNKGIKKITRRPQLSVLINNKFPALRDWKEAVGECLKNISNMGEK